MVENISFRHPRKAPHGNMSRQSEKFLIGQSRKFLLTAARLKDGTNRDEPRGTGLAGLVEESARPEDDPAGGGRAHESKRALGAQAAKADETRGRPRGGSRVARTGIEPQARPKATNSGHRDPEAA